MIRRRLLRLTVVVAVVVAVGTLVRPTAASAQEGCGVAVLPGPNLAYCLAGNGLPVVVLEAGMRSDHLAWRRLMPRVAEHTTTLAYDRAGMGQSGPGVPPRTSATIATELRALLRYLELEGPYLLVGHSIGGRHLRTFAASYPEEVAALVLIDSPHEDFEDRLMALLSPMERSARRNALAANRATLPDAVQLEYRGIELSDPPGRAPDVPLVVVSAGRHGWRPALLAEEIEDIWQATQQEMADQAADGRYVYLEQAGHNSHLEHPETVMKLIEELLAELGR